MIEVEKKFILNEEEKKRIIENAQFLGEKIFTDTYYDTENYYLTLKDYWLRFREGKAELKVPLEQKNDTFINQYEEIVDEKRIREKLGIRECNNLLNDLNMTGYSPFCTCKTTRTKYKNNIFSIDLDFVDFGDFTYNIAEVELMVESEKDVDGALDKISNFAKEKKFKIESVRGKVIEYLKRKKPEHYNKLLAKGIVKE